MLASAGRGRQLAVLLLALLLSGSAGLVNQVVWQRGLKVFLGGSETLSSMTVVVVFMFGLGAGSVWMGMRSDRLRNPIMALALTEVALGLVNMTICWLLGIDISESIYAAQRLAVGAGVQLRAIYVVGAVLILGPPCFLMGMTMPLSSESSQRQLRHEEKTLIPLLFVVNTSGAVLGSLGTGFYLMPYFGQRVSLLVAAAANLAAAALLARLARAVGPAPAPAATTHSGDATSRAGRFLPEDVLGFLLGFFALGYEIFLFRIVALAYEPLPYTFAATLCGFLALWSIGVYLSRMTTERIVPTLFVTATLIAFLPAFFQAYVPARQWSVGPPLYFVPCVFFGLLYGHIVSRSARHWGVDVGRFYGLNTVGSCLGILFFTLVGYEIGPVFGGAFLGAGLLVSLALWKVSTEPTPGPRRFWRFTAAVMAAASVVAVASGLALPFRTTSVGRIFYGRDGVIEVRNGELFWDGLWHSTLVANRSHVGTRNWLHAVAPLLSHEGPVVDAVVIGLGAGITSSTLSEVSQIGVVDTYDINHTLRPFLATYPRETLGVGTDSRVHLIWQDGRSGLALNSKKYDLITQQPLYLKQAGSSILLSREYLKLAQARLKPGGVIAIYSNAEGNREAALLIRQTTQSVFRYCESFEGGYMVIASDSPIDLSRDAVSRRLDLYPSIKADVTYLEATKGTPDKPYRFYDLYDSTRLPWTGSPYVITDDHPLVEYPDVVSKLVSTRNDE